MIDYARNRFRIPSNIPLLIVSFDVVPDTCYRAIRFRTPTARRSDLLLFLSPDQRFLSRDLWNIQEIPEGRKLQEQDAAFSAGLTEGDFPSRGSPQAPITITVFSDFQCPYCRKQAEILRMLHESEARIVFRHLPLSIHPWAKAAAELSSCVHKQSNAAFWDLHDFFFQSQDELTRDNLLAFVKKALKDRGDVNSVTLDQCFSSGGGATEVDADMSFARTYNVNSVPTLFINGTRASGVIGEDDIRALVAGLKGDRK